MKLLILWYTDGDHMTRKFLRKEVIEKPWEPHLYLIAWMTTGKIWKNFAMRKVSEEQWEAKFRKRPVEPSAT